MKVLIVCNNAYYKGNGLCTAVTTLHSKLREAGIEARIMSCENPEEGGVQPEFPLKHFKFPFFERIIYTNGFRYAAADRKKMQEAIAWADIVHLEEGFPIEAIAGNIARKMGKPCVGSYHLLTENILANLGMKKDVVINDIVTFFWRILVYDKCKIVHCPTKKVAEYLRAHGFKSEMRAISNGITLPAAAVSEAETSPFNILCIGRLSNEKSQATLLDAMKYSAHAKEIRLVFAGKGPKEKKYRRMAEKLVKDGVLAYKPEFGFHSKEDLAELCKKAYLYIHCAWVEVEGLSCIEALSYGAVPVIAEGKCTATAQFALDSRSTFPEGDAKALAAKIDYWIEHPSERAEMSKAYIESARNYDIEDSIAGIIKMYKDALGE